MRVCVAFFCSIIFCVVTNVFSPVFRNPNTLQEVAIPTGNEDAIKALDPVAQALNAFKGEVALETAENRSTKSKKALLIIAISPTTDALRFAATWSILECFAADFDKIVISSSNVLHRNQTASVPACPFVTYFLRKVREAMPDVGSKIEDRYFFNNRYDAGLWCDAMVSTPRNSNISILEKGTENRTSYVGGSSEYDRFMLINDSMMAVRKTNEFLTALEEKKADLVSLNSWGKNATDPNFWVESPLRVFSLRGIQEYADRICSLGEIQPARDCPWLIDKSRKEFEETSGRKGMERASRKERKKRCITVKTEIEVAKFYPPDKVFGLYPSYLEETDGSQTSWTISYRVWKELRDKMSFPALKVSHPETLEPVMRLQPEDTRTCTKLYDESWIERVDLLKMPLEFVS